MAAVGWAGFLVTTPGLLYAVSWRLKEVDLPAHKNYAGYADRFKASCAAAYDEAR